MNDAAPPLVRPDQTDDSTDATAPRGAYSCRAPVGAIVRAARATRIVQKSKENRAADGAAGRALDHAGARRNSAAHIETADGSPRNRERSGSAGHLQTEDATVVGFNGAAYKLPADRFLFLASCLRDPDANSRARLDFGGELRASETRYDEQEDDDDDKRAHHCSFFGGVISPRCS